MKSAAWLNGRSGEWVPGRLATRPQPSTGTRGSSRPEASHPRDRASFVADCAGLVKKGMNLRVVLDELGPPDFVERWTGNAVAWRYDMDAVRPFSLVVIIDHQRVESLQKWEPPLWHGYDLVAQAS